VTGPEVLRTDDLDAAVAHHVDQLGFRLVMVAPADSPRLAVVVAPDGTTRRLERDAGETARVPEPPDGIEVSPGPEADATGAPGRAGMRYRDLVPSRLGGRCIASHITIPEGGPVPDYVHHHRVGVQVIACVAGWVRVVYEDQGPPFVLRPGDAVLQPPGIRHRVLEASPGLEVVELSCPAEHETFVDHELRLPTGLLAPDRDFGGQRFVHHVAVAAWGRRGGFEARESAVADATHGRAALRSLRPAAGVAAPITVAEREDGTGRVRFWFVAAGAISLAAGGRPPVELTRAGSLVASVSVPIDLSAWTTDAELLEIVFAPS
jgi:quercetin dioxygenase-like cupin family protein